MWKHLHNLAIGWKIGDILARKVDRKSDSGEDSDGNRKPMIGSWRKGSPCY